MFKCSVRGTNRRIPASPAIHSQNLTVFPNSSFHPLLLSSVLALGSWSCRALAWCFPSQLNIAEIFRVEVGIDGSTKF